MATMRPDTKAPAVKNKPVPLTEEEIEAITDMAAMGWSLSRIAKNLNRAPAAVWRILRKDPAGPNYDLRENATKAYKDYSLQNRLNVMNKFFEKCEEMVDSVVVTPLDMQQLTTALAILVDKRRLEDGEATSRADVRQYSDARKTLEAKLTELHERKRLAPAIETKDVDLTQDVFDENGTPVPTVVNYRVLQED